MVFSPDYRRIITETPHVKYKTSIAVWIILGVFILIIVLGLIGILALSVKR
jgi:flagellar basal body-associated protein FliL